MNTACMRVKILSFLVISIFVLSSPADSKFKLEKKADDFMSRFCYDCHDDETQKGNIRIDNLEKLSKNARLDILNRIKEQVYSGNMPPKKKKQPKPSDTDKFLVSISKELDRYKASKLEDKLRYYKYVLKLKKSTNTAMLLGELGKLPVCETIKSRVLNFWFKLVTGQNDRKL